MVSSVCGYMKLVGALLNKRPRTPPGTASGLDYQTADSENLLKRVRPPGPPPEEVSSFVQWFWSSEYRRNKMKCYIYVLKRTNQHIQPNVTSI